MLLAVAFFFVVAGLGWPSVVLCVITHPDLNIRFRV